MLQDFLGESNLNVFASGIGAFATAIVAYNNKLTENGGIDGGLIASSANAGLALAELNKSWTASSRDSDWQTVSIGN